jgi:hypothetical protein
MLALASLLVAGQLELETGELVVGRGIYNETLALDASIGFGVALGYYGRIFSVAPAARYVPEHALAGDDGGSFTQLDLGFQLGIHTAVTPRVELLGQLTPAYSMLYDSPLDDARGLAITILAGAVYRVSKKLQVGGGVSYQYGAQQTGEGMSAATRLTSLSLFVMSR